MAAPSPDGQDPVSVLALSTAAPNSGQKQLAVQRKSTSADIALSALGLVRPGVDEAEGCSMDEEKRIAKMKELLHTRGVKKRLEDDFELKCGQGEDVSEVETETEFLTRAIETLRKENVKDIIKAFDRVDKNNRQAASKDAKFVVQRNQCRAKIAKAAAVEQAEDKEFGTLHKGTAEEYEDEFAEWWAKLSGEKDFAAYCGASVSQGNSNQSRQAEDALMDAELAKVGDALKYFHSNAKLASPEVQPALGDAAEINAELANWHPSQVLSAYRQLSLAKHPDKAGGSPEAFQELAAHAKVLMEASARYHKSSKRGTVKKERQVATAGRNAPKAAICAELPESLKLSMAFFGLEEELFVGGAAEIKRLRLRLGELKEQKEKDIQRERDPEKFKELLRSAGEQVEEDSKDSKDPKKLKASCSQICRTHYTAVYTYIQKLK